MTSLLLQKLVIKIGTNVLSQEDGHLDHQIISHLVEQMATLAKSGYKVILVTSGAVGAGRTILPSLPALNRVEKRQVQAAVGQPRLMQYYQHYFEQYGLHCAQVLATKEDFRDRTHYLNMRSCFEAMQKAEIIPIVNENDVVSVSELMFTDNDELAGLVATMTGADALMILSNVDGIYDGPPDNINSKVLHQISAEDDTIQRKISPVKSSFGRGGMLTKFRMAQKTARMGIRTYIANGKTKDIVTNIVAGKSLGTCVQSNNQLSNVKKWMAWTGQQIQGRVYINEGAETKLLRDQSATSLLPVGITKVEGPFNKGDLLQIMNSQNQAIGVGLAQYDYDTAIKSLGQTGKKALIHYDYLYLEK